VKLSAWLPVVAREPSGRGILEYVNDPMEAI
jgi:hypothetical protein